MLSDRWRDRMGLAFFIFATVVGGLAAWEHPTLLGWLYAVHNLLLAGCYLRRRPAKAYDRTGLWLGMIAAMLPAMTFSGQAPVYLMVPGFLGYGLCLWALVTLGPRFGIAPADRGLTVRGPYHWIRHPMYLGELVFRIALVLASRPVASGLIVALLLAGIQIWRIRREEVLIAGYACYTRVVRWRLVPGIW